jgi:hypothetical protein
MENFKLKRGVLILIVVFFVFVLGFLAFYFIGKSRIGLDSVPRDSSSGAKTDIPHGETAVSDLNFWEFYQAISNSDGEKNYLALFQNSMELRPGGGFIGSFALVTVENGKIKEKKIFDTGIFDGYIKGSGEPPYPVKKFLTSPELGIRDANWSLDFPTNAKLITDLYHKSGATEKIDGVIGITTEILPFFLEKTGPIILSGVPGEFTAKNCLEKLEYEVEWNYPQRGVEKKDRKQILTDLTEKILDFFKNQNKLEQIALLDDLKALLKQKEVQLFFDEPTLEAYVQKNGWGGEMAPSLESDYLSLVDANLGALKTDRCISRDFLYKVDFSLPKEPKASLEVTYKHNCKEKDFMTDNYHSYLRVYTRNDAWLSKTEGFDAGRLDEIMKDRNDAVIEREKDKVAFGNLAFVFLGQERKYSFFYTLSPELTLDSYQLVFQRQAGMNPPHLKVVIKDAKKETTLFDGEAKSDLLIK